MALPIDRADHLAYYALLGFVTIPVQPRGKRPLRKGWRLGDPSAWMDAPADANVGILCGDTSGGLVVLDFDDENGPHRVLKQTPRQLAQRTMVAKTARGWHIYLQRRGTSTRSPRPGLDVRGEGSMVVAPPSMHPNGTQYRFLELPQDVATASQLGIDDEVFNPNTGGVGGQAVSLPTTGQVLRAVDWPRLETRIAQQAPKLRSAWRKLREGTSGDDFDRSRADFAVARCLHEGGYTEDEIASVLMALQGSKARQRGENYARLTAQRARR